MRATGKAVGPSRQPRTVHAPTQFIRTFTVDSIKGKKQNKKQFLVKNSKCFSFCVICDYNKILFSAKSFVTIFEKKKKRQKTDNLGNSLFFTNKRAGQDLVWPGPFRKKKKKKGGRVCCWNFLLNN